MTDAIIGWSTVVRVNNGDSPEDWFKLGEIKQANPPSAETDQHEATHMQSPGRKKEFIAGMTDPGQASMNLNFVPGSGTDEYIIAWRASGEYRPLQYVYPLVPGQTLRRTETIDAAPQTYTPTLETNAVSEAQLNLKVSGDSEFGTIDPDDPVLASVN